MKRVVLVMNGFGCQGLSKSTLILCPQIHQIFLNINRRNTLQCAALEIFIDNFCHAGIERYGLCFPVVPLYLQGKPRLIYKGDKIIVPFLWRKHIYPALCYRLLLFFVLCPYFLLPCVRRPLSRFSGFCWGQPFRRYPCGEPPHLLSVCITGKTDGKGIRNDLAVLLLFSDVSH